MASALDIQAIGSPFDGIAGAYDARFTHSPIGDAQRSATSVELRKAFAPGTQILEIGSGTGVDACFLAEHGVNVFGFDSSPEMIRVADARVQSRRQFFRNASVELTAWPAERMSELTRGRMFDGAFSNFGALNCLSSIRQFADELALCVKRGGPVLLCLMGSCCVWEIMWFLFHGQPRPAFRRFSANGAAARIGGNGVMRIWYPTVRQLQRAFAPEFHLRGLKAVGLAVPPTYTQAQIQKVPGVLKAAAAIDARVARYPLLNRLGDHILFHFERAQI